jgi:hypothetical protein
MVMCITKIKDLGSFKRCEKLKIVFTIVCMYKGWAIKFSPCTVTFYDLLCSVFTVQEC